jgi:hypothetical protein
MGTDANHPARVRDPTLELLLGHGSTLADEPCSTRAARRASRDASGRRRGRSVDKMQFSPELRERVASGRITLSFRLWSRPQVKVGGQYAAGAVRIEIDAIEMVPFSSVTAADVRRAGEQDRESLRRRAAHAGPIDDDTLVYRIEFHVVP